MKTDTMIRAADIAAFADLHADGMLCAILRQARSLSAREIIIGKTAVVFRTHRTFYEKMTLLPEYTRALIHRIASLSKIDGRIRLYGKFVHFGTDPVLIYTVFVQSILVLSLPDPPLCLPPLEDMGLSESQIEKLRDIRMQKSGLVLFCSPDERDILTAAASIFSDMYRGENALHAAPPVVRRLCDKASVRTAIETAVHSFVFATIASRDTASAVGLLKKFNTGKATACLRCIIAHELLYDGRDIHLLFDIAFPKHPPETLPKRLSPDPYSDDPLSHCTNVASEILKSLKLHSRLPRTVKPVVPGKSIISHGTKFVREAVR
ncbi:hypothetical protein [Treponema sp. Marseille-Q4132]|uniref:hypothetical protein n=1 Tax=Treponema sp. Marseille-Q4132 TaxID=2766701 RepID=UPI0016532A59|nr:hypothetical protein [Treponema sp. Marseille-Q4132]QNL98135.1 hypothetical protein H9I35_05185 [Treponema sp. Marseille-Q4132]